jgi:hypothetical protein
MEKWTVKKSNHQFSTIRLKGLRIRHSFLSLVLRRGICYQQLNYVIRSMTLFCKTILTQMGTHSGTFSESQTPERAKLLSSTCWIYASPILFTTKACVSYVTQILLDIAKWALAGIGSEKIWATIKTTLRRKLVGSSATTTLFHSATPSSTTTIRCILATASLTLTLT